GGVADLERLGVREQVQERDQATVAPAHDADPLRVDLLKALQHELPAGEYVLDFQAAVVDQLPEFAAVAAAAAVIRGNDGVALLQQLAENGDVIGADVAVHTAMCKEH